MFNWKWSSTKTEPHNKAANAQRKPLKDLQKTWETFAEDYFSFKKMTKAGSLERSEHLRKTFAQKCSSVKIK